MTHYQSLFLVGCYGVLSNTCVFLLAGSTARYFVDQIPVDRRVALVILVIAENLCVLLGCLLSWGVFRYEPFLQNSNPTIRVILLVCLFAVGSIGQLVQQTLIVVLERDWVVVVAKSRQQQQQSDQDDMTLGEMNVVVRQIDLSCQILSPVCAGLLIGLYKGDDLGMAALAVGLLNACSMIIELIFMTRVYILAPALAHRSHALMETAEPKESRLKDSSVLHNFRIYFQQSVGMSGLALAMLYLNVLSFGTLMTAYLVSQSISVEQVGVWRGISSVSGLCGTLAYRLASQRHIPLPIIGMFSILFQCGLLAFAIVALFLPQSASSIALSLLMVSVTVSRIGLWVFDITVTQLMQEHVPAGIRGTVGGTQQSLNAFFQISSFALSIVFHDPIDFPVYATVGFGATILAAVLFSGRMAHFGRKPSDETTASFDT